MSKIVEFNLYVNIHGEVEVEDYEGDPNELLDAIFPDGWEGEVLDTFTDPQFMSKGYIEVTDLEEEEEED